MFKILDEVCTPKRATRYSAYVDLFAREDYVIGAGETKVIKLGVKLDLELFFKQNETMFFNVDKSLQRSIDIPRCERFLKSHYLEIALRSSLAVKGLIIANGIGVIDLDYKQEVGLIVHNSYKSVGARWLDHDEQYCPKCGNYQIDDDDGVNLSKDIGDVYCRNCNTDFVYVKNFRPTPSNFHFDCEKEWINTSYEESKSFKISKGDKVAQCTLKEHKGYLMGYESDVIREGGFGSTGGAR